MYVVVVNGNMGETGGAYGSAGSSKLDIRFWALGRMGKGLRTSRDRGSLGHLDWLWGNYPGLLDLQLRSLLLLKSVVDTLSVLDTLFSLEGFCVG